jgi:hypothetical protein
MCTLEMTSFDVRIEVIGKYNTHGKIKVQMQLYVVIDVLTAVILKSYIFWDSAPWLFDGKCRLLRQVEE